MDGLMSKLRKLDAYPKVIEDFYSRTLSGGNHPSFLYCYVSPLLLRAPYVNYIAFVSRLVTTDTPLALPNISDSFSCLAQIEKALQRHGGRLEHNETCCSSCYGAEICKREGFLQRIEDEEGEGCNIYGFLEVNKVAGNLHFSPGKSFQQSGVHVHDLLAFQKDSFNKWLHTHSSSSTGTDKSQEVTFTEEHVSFLHFLTNVCAIVGVAWYLQLSSILAPKLKT